MARYVVRMRRGGPYDFSRDMRRQEGWDEHASFMDGIFEDGFLLMVGPLEGGYDTLWLVEAESAEQVRARAAGDPWAANGMLTPLSVERWDIVMDGLSPGH